VSAFWGQLPSLVALAAHVAICVTGVLIAGVAALWLCRSRSAPLRHALALGVLVATLTVPAIAALYQYRFIRFQFGAAPKSSLVSAATATPGEGAVATPVEEPAVAGTPRSHGPSWSFILSAAFAATWAMGLLGLVTRALVAHRRQRQYLASLQPVSDKFVLALIDRLRRALGIRRHIQLLTSRETPWPFTLGLVHPRIIVPGELLEERYGDRLEAVLLHELAHVRRGDCGVASLEELARLIYWWNPLVAVLTSHLAAAREEICDAYVLAHSGDGAPLAQYLLCSAEKAAYAQIRFAVGLSLHDPLSLRRRIAQLLTGDRNTMIRISSLGVGTLVLASLVVAFAFTHANYASAELLVGIPVNLGPVVNSATSTDTDPEISADGLTLYFMRGGPPGFGTLMTTHRDSLSSPWGSPVSIPQLATPVRPAEGPTVTEDELLMYFFGDATGNSVNEIYQSTRPSASDPWGQPVNIGPPVNSPFRDRHPSISPDGLTLYFVSNRDNPSQSQLDIYVAQRDLRTNPFGAPVRLGSQVNTDFNEGGVEVSSNGLLLLFHSDRDGPSTEQDIFYSARFSINEPWGPAQKLGPTVNSANSAQGLPSISSEGRFLYYGATSDPTNFNTSDLFVVEIIPEPAAITLMIVGGGLCVCMFIGRRKGRARDLKRSCKSSKPGGSPL
jgi:beta-lactamase regulating signal transducer with metallopeptidase domain